MFIHFHATALLVPCNSFHVAKHFSCLTGTLFKTYSSDVFFSHIFHVMQHVSCHATFWALCNISRIGQQCCVTTIFMTRPICFPCNMFLVTPHFSCRPIFFKAWNISDVAQDFYDSWHSSRLTTFLKSWHILLVLSAKHNMFHAKQHIFVGYLFFIIKIIHVVQHFLCFATFFK